MQVSTTWPAVRMVELVRLGPVRAVQDWWRDLRALYHLVVDGEAEPEEPVDGSLPEPPAPVDPKMLYADPISPLMAGVDLEQTEPTGES